MTLFQAKPLDPKVEARKRMLQRIGIVLLVLAIIALPVVWHFRYWPEEHAVDKFLTAVEKKDYKQAFALWNADPDWEQHVEKYSNYPFGQFQLDWGPTGDYGDIKSHDVRGAAAPRSKVSSVSGVVVAVTINGRAEPACLWVEKSNYVISFSPLPCTVS